MPSFEFLPMSDIIFNLDTCFYIIYLGLHVKQPTVHYIVYMYTLINFNPSKSTRGSVWILLALVCMSPQVFDGAVIVLSLAPMVASTVANGPSSPWDAISLIITLRIWRVKRIIDGEAGKNLVSTNVVLSRGYNIGQINFVDQLREILNLS